MRGVEPHAEAKRRHRILHVITRFIPGGADENTYLSAVGMDSRRYEVDLAVGREWEHSSFSLPDHIRLHVVPHLVREAHPVYDLMALNELALLMRRGRYDLVHTHTAKAGVLGRVAAAIARVPRVVHTYHGLTFHPAMSRPRRLLYVAIERAAAALTHRFIAVGEEVRAGYVRAQVVSRDRCAVIYSGMDLLPFKQVSLLGETEVQALRREFGLPAGALVLGAVARLEERKGHAYLIDAVAELAAEIPQLHLLVAGDGPMREALGARVRRMGLGGQVHFLGHRRDVEQVMAMIDIFVLTSTLEGLPRVLVQAAAAGKPIVAFGAEGVREIVVDGLNGYVVQIGDVRALVAHLRRMLGDLETARTMGRQGIALVDERWSVGRMIGALSETYDEILEAA